MPRIKIHSDHETAVLEKLGNSVHGIARPFVCAGSLVPPAPLTLGLKETELVFGERRTRAAEEAALRLLLSQCRAAPFGKGSKTLYNPRVRNALEMKAKGGGFSLRGFDPSATGVLERVREKLCPNDPSPLVAELYNLNVYGPGGHFAPHKDTPRGDDMVGTLVVCVPWSFYGGRLVVSHGGTRKLFDWGREISRQDEPSRIHWAAFFGDVDHSIEEVRVGQRITLTYVLRRGEGASRPPAPTEAVSERLQAAFLDATLDSRFFAKGATLGFPCFHMYSRQAAFQDSKRARLTVDSAHKLKGRDYSVASAALHARLAVTLEPYLIETCGGERWRLKKFPSAASRRLLGGRLTQWELEEAMSIAAHSEEDEDLGVTWVLPPPGAETPLMPSGDHSATDSNEPPSELFHSCEYSATGYFGNEGCDSDFYLYAALHVAMPAWGKGPRNRSGAGIKVKGGQLKGARRRTGPGN